MKKIIQLIAFIIVIALGVAGGWKIIHSAKPAAAEQSEHGHGESQEHEGHIELTAQQIKNAGIKVEEARSAKIHQTLRLFGTVGPNEDRLAHVMPRYAGIVKDVRKKVGEVVKKGEVLVVVESNESLQPYEVKSEIAGTVAEKHVTLGELVSQEQRMFTITDLSTVWVNLNVYRQDFSKLHVGQKAFIEGDSETGRSESEISYISAFGSESTQTMLARTVIPNPHQQLKPGLFVEAEVVLDERSVDVAVRQGAIQTIDDKPVVFVRDGDAFEARPVKIGIQDHDWIEIIDGLLPGDLYVSANSFILKSEAGKSGAAHEH